MNTLNAYQLPPDILKDVRTTCCEATGPGDTPVRITVFSQALCDNPQFRAALRYHAPILLGIHHFHILATLQWGEVDGRMFLVSEVPEGAPLGNHQLRDLEWDQIIDIAWQMTSAVQHAHNLGLAHGDLTVDRVFVSPQIRAQVEGFGLGQWQRDAEDHALTDAFALQRRDIQQLAVMLAGLTPLAAEQDQPALQEYRSLVDQLQKTPETHTARDVQRQLGQLLLQDTEDEIEMIDQRSGISHTGRSLVDELFEPPYEPSMSEDPSTSQLTGPSIWLEILCLVALAVLLIAGIWLASG